MSSSPADPSKDVNDFLQRIKELGDRRDQEDEERNRKLEEEIVQGRKERQARRAERARSISPTKSSPANTPEVSRNSVPLPSGLSNKLPPIINPQGDSEPRRDMAIDDATHSLAGSSTSPTKENFSPIDIERDIAHLKQGSPIKTSPSSAMPTSKNSPLSWQRRPNSQSSDRSRSRPLSMVATENAARSPRATPEPSPALSDGPTLSREQIAQSLASKDPAWFRQTADRGLTSPAYRRNQVEDDDRSDHGSNSTRVQMPGMSREAAEPDKRVDEDSINRSSSPSRTSTAFSSGSRSSYQPTQATSGGIGSPIPLTNAQRLDPPSLDSGVRMSPSQGRISPDRVDRPASPTKGMGGFVQSAMMKRSDSVNKRWSVQSPPGLSQGNSVANSRISQDPASSLALGNTVNAASGVSRPSSWSRDSSPLPLSRPTSSHSNATIAQEGTASSARSSMTASTTNDRVAKPVPPTSSSHAPKSGQEDTSRKSSTRNETTPPSSPSKTMDAKRWSPTKSSWLESALNKPESSKPKPVPPPQQPSWMAEINKSKQKGSVDMNHSPTVAPKHEVNIGGLMRSPPPGVLAKPLSKGGLPPAFSSGKNHRASPGSIISQDIKTSSIRTNPSEQVSPTTTSGAKSLPASGKVKPETPPKKDFRTVLKPRPLPTDDSGKEEPEFKNVFGQLRRTKTQNYVAPDELKGNITRGKAALNVTGGPKQTERKDEFKEAILRKKEDFKKAQLEGKGVTRSTRAGSQDAALPEALAKRQALGSSGSTAGLDSSSKQDTVRESPKPGLPSKELSAPGRLQGTEVVGSKLAGSFNPALAEILARRPPSTASGTSVSSSPASARTFGVVRLSTTNVETREASPGPQLTHMTKSRARGPRRKAPSSVPATSAAPEETSKSTFSSTPNLESPTKSSGVPEKLNIQMPSKFEPSSQADIEIPLSQPSSPRKLDMKRRSQFLQEVPSKSNNREPLDSPKPESPSKKTDSPSVPMKTEGLKLETEAPPITKTKPDTSTKSPLLISKISERIPDTELPETTPFRALPFSPTKPTRAEQPQKTPTFIPTNIQSTQRIDQFEESNTADPTSAKSVRNVAAFWDQPSATQPVSSPPRTRSPIKLPTKDDEKAAMVRAGLLSPSPIKGKAPIILGLQDTRESTSTQPPPITPAKGLISPPLSAGLMPAKAPKPTINSPVPQTSEALRLLADFFGDDRSSQEFVTDTAALLSTRPEQPSNIKSIRVSLYQLLADGKKQLVPTHHERLLFEGNMYLCIHSFYNAVGKKVNEVNWWIGDEVPASTVEGAEIFAQREAKSASGRLVKTRQGKENPEFFQALGGIIIIRRGSSNKYDSLAPHILCGRKHLGQIAFDEVDYSPGSLCSGFPYLISTQSGKSYLWKGKGSGIDELSCARIIGMDFGLTGEIEEVEDGTEPASFLQVFGNGAKIPKSADHWRMKPNYDMYCGRLFCADSTAKSQIVEISPFSQCDLSPSNIYILDAFFEIYIVVGSRAQSQYPAFHNALIFAQEYGILAAGTEDRPMVPFSTVVLEGIPKDMKGVFRKWSDTLTPTIMQPGSSLQRGRSLRVVPLTAALEATQKTL